MESLFWSLLLLLLFNVCLCQQGEHYEMDHTTVNQDYSDNVVDLLEALNVTRSVKGVTKAKGRDPDSSSWKFRQRVPYLTLPRDYSVYLLSTIQETLGLHFVAKQAKNNKGTLIAFLSPAAIKSDGHPLLRLVSDTRTDQFILEYRTPQTMEPASIFLPGGSPFIGSQWARVALNLNPQKVILYLDCEEPVVFKKEGEEEILSLILPLDLEISFASTPEDKESKFLGYWQMAEISPTGFNHRPWHCENRSDSIPLPYSFSEIQHMDDEELQREPRAPDLSDSSHYQQQQSEVPPQISNKDVRLQRLEEVVQSLIDMLDMVKAQNVDLQARVKALESCECRRPTCVWEGKEYQDSETWKKNACNICVCVGGTVTCSLRKDTPQCLAAYDPICSLIVPLNVFSSGCLDGHHDGDTWRKDPCTRCVCQNGTVHCEKEQCPELSCLKRHTPPGQCCATCQQGCEYEGIKYRNGDYFLSQSNPCVNCSCLNNLVRCLPVQCPLLACKNPLLIPGQCCPSCPVCELDGKPLIPGKNATTRDGCHHCICQDGEVQCTNSVQCPRICTHGIRRESCCPDCSACEIHGDIIPNGTTFQNSTDPCESCMCRDGSVHCVRISCPELSCVVQEKVSGECCSRCQGCVDGKTLRKYGEEWKPLGQPCQSCQCVEGSIQCRKRHCASLCRNPLPPRPGTCCPVCDGCLYNGRNYLNEQIVRSSDQCTHCICENGNVQCKPTACPSAPCRNPVRKTGECCPRCEGCEFESRVLAEGQVFISAHDPCLQCTCLDGEVSCDHLDRRCSTPQCSHPGRVKGQCCPSCEVCDFERKLYTDDQTFQPPGHGPCFQCVCTKGNVRCVEETCPPTSCPNPEKDPERCCPVCKVCVQDGVEFSEGVEWEVNGDPCSSCTCLNGDTVCGVSVCPPVSCLHPTKEEGECCPVCHNCRYNQRIYNNDKIFTDPDNPCQECKCKDGTVQCSPIVCTPVLCSRPERAPGQCCVKCPECKYQGHIFLDGEQFPSSINQCHECGCHDGLVTCTERVCPGALCSYPLPGSCCRNNCNGCNYAGKEYPNGADFPHPTDKCRQCHCINGNVQCLAQRCPPLLCSEPFNVPGECCPQCPVPPADCPYFGVTYRHMQRFYDPSDKCRDCICNNGTVTCQRKPCGPAPCSHPLQGDCCRSCDGCLLSGKELANGEQFSQPSDRCSVCVCWEGSVKCQPKTCPILSCPFPAPGQCCKECQDCQYMGEIYLNGQEFSSPQDSCSRCVCEDGFVTCSKKPCYKAGCTHPSTPSGKCCPVCDGCLYNGISLTNGQTVPDPSSLDCSECTCQAGSVQCVRRLCAPTSCPHPMTGPCDCPICHGCHFQGHSYIDGEVFRSPKSQCEQCRCMRGHVTCGPQPCTQVICTHPAEDSCMCPVCDGCNYNGKECTNGESFPDPEDECSHCSCRNGEVTCVSATCPRVSCLYPTTPPGECCPRCTGICKHNGRVYQSGDHFQLHGDICTKCSCQNEMVSCQRVQCSQECTHPLPFPASSCCPVCDRCFYDNREYLNHQTFTSASDPCQRCVCVAGSVTCTHVVCPLISCANPVIKPGQCCRECPVCHYHDREYSEGALWISHTDPCLQCTCTASNVFCERPQCPLLPCTQQVTDPGACCSRCRGCVYNGREYKDNSNWVSSSDHCMSCICINGVTTCSRLQCIVTCTNQVTVPGECCPMCADCIFNNKVHVPGESYHPSNDPCEICTCERLPDGRPYRRCTRKQCPSLLDCPRSHIIPPIGGQCCPTCAQALSNCTDTLVGSEIQANDDPCYTCYCKDLTWVCARQPCPKLSCPQAEQFTRTGSCCPSCKECLVELEGRLVPDGETWTDRQDPCVTCTCTLGQVECRIEECTSIQCQEGEVKVKQPGACCHECQVSAVSCWYQGERFHSNEHWQVDECTACTCVSGDVHCHSERCPQVSCTAEETPALIPGMCCPHCIPRPATCIAFGDPHYRTFDGKMYHFQGSCTYVFSEDCEGGDFSIHVTNDDRGQKGVSWTKEVIILFGDAVIQLLQDWVVMVDYQTVELPFLKEPYIYIEKKTNTILLNSNIGIKVQWNGRSHLEVSVPGTYRDHLCGLCGNFNNYPQDDFRDRRGQILLSEAAFGNSWRVQSSNDSSSSCWDGQDVDPCKQAGYRARKEANGRCKLLKSTVFEPCHRVVSPEMFFASCVYDLCACGAGEECLCDVLEAYASECREAGVILQWRSPALCAVGCPHDRGYVFDECGPPCPKTCFNKDVPLGVLESHCFKPCVPGCQCPAGLVEHESHCIPPESCPKVIHGNL
ncbi:hypothetical protein GDO86_006046 [Hymenochirus boettgeri]|uniref:Kielin/chordin-like protein n=1 Tax=Hymenochirus boettgeri TaxID=247094 RepID=A0A8T2J944_9PIPI|nr:hypothetical protein GDO86_006046 [Hymenochirus boettgeri]